MFLDVATWGAAQWTIYAIFIGLLTSMFTNMWATNYIRYKEEKARIVNQPVDWKKEFVHGTLYLVFIIILFAVIIILM